MLSHSILHVFVVLVVVCEETKAEGHCQKQENLPSGVSLLTAVSSLFLFFLFYSTPWRFFICIFFSDAMLLKLMAAIFRTQSLIFLTAHRSAYDTLSEFILFSMRKHFFRQKRAATKPNFFLCI